jgi:hypothetical protein
VYSGGEAYDMSVFLSVSGVMQAESEAKRR